MKRILNGMLEVKEKEKKNNATQERCEKGTKKEPNIVSCSCTEA
jgi:hypothetical protein